MQETARQNGILSYAGHSKSTLFALAKQAFAQADFDVPERFSRFLPLFPIELVQNMDYIGAKPQGNKPVAPSGFSIDAREYHRKLFAQMPHLYESDNYRRNFDYEGKYLGRGIFTVDKAWATNFPQYQPFMGEKLMIYLLGGGHQAVAVPESLYPRGMGILAGVERRMEITLYAEQFVQYAQSRVAAGHAYNAEAFGREYLEITGLEAVTISQNELGRVLQDVSIAKSLQSESPSTGLFTESAKRVEHLRQYVPFHYACDTFEPSTVTRHTARLCQPSFQGMEFISDLWMPYQDVNSYIDKEHMTLDMARLCEGYQIAPAYDPETGGGVYPDRLRVVIVRDREISMMTGDVLNNPAYGGGMSPQGMIGRQVFIPDSRELLRQRKLMPEEIEIAIRGTALSAEEYRRALALATLQESKGKLVDAMYRREAALSQMVEGGSPYLKAKQMLDEKVKVLQDGIARQSAVWRHGQVSGYDADIDYLRRKQLDREGTPEDEQHSPIAFFMDAKREQSIESGYAMRNGFVRVSYEEAYALPKEGEAALDEEVEEAIDANEAAIEEDTETAADVGNAAIGGEAEEAVDVGGETTAEGEESGEATAEGEESGEAKAEGEESGEATAAREARRPVTFGDIAPHSRPAPAPDLPTLKHVVSHENKPKTQPINKRGKMASMVQKKRKK